MPLKKLCYREQQRSGAVARGGSNEGEDNVFLKLMKLQMFVC